MRLQRMHWIAPSEKVIMPGHIHLIARMGLDAIRLGQWVGALKAVVGGLERREECPAGAPGTQNTASGDAAHNMIASLQSAGRVPSRSVGSNDFEYAPFSQRGGLGKAHQLHGDQRLPLLEELNTALAA